MRVENCATLIPSRCNDLLSGVDEVKELVKKLNDLPPNDKFWHNEWQFTKPVFTNNSRQGNDAQMFFIYFERLPAKLKKHIKSANT